MASVGRSHAQDLLSDLLYFIVLVWSKQLKRAPGAGSVGFAFGGYEERPVSLRPSDTSWVLVAPQVLLSLS